MTRFSAAHHAPGTSPVKAVPPRPAPLALACGGSALTGPPARRYMAATETTGKQDQPTGSLHGSRGSLGSEPASGHGHDTGNDRLIQQRGSR